MAHKLTMYVTPQGECRFLQTDQSRRMFREAKKHIRRISHVEPVNLPLRVLFRLLRLCCSEYGWLAAWTRRWPCRWQVNFSPIGGPVFRADAEGSVFQGRRAAIDFEIAVASGYLARAGALPAAASQQGKETEHVSSFKEAVRIDSYR